MRREIYFDMAMERTKKYVFGNQGTGFRVVATGFWSGYYHTKVNAEKKIKVLHQLLSSGYICVLGPSIMALQQS